uniref:Uncharacterized protein B1642C07.43 n=1 Tax=Oryza sativa subsp. japonica TaxID=39947 RepID=Q5F1X9_ORYSJ|nr:hypothetical protein [Oryza sativa Japonica Group]
MASVAPGVPATAAPGGAATAAPDGAQRLQAPGARVDSSGRRLLPMARRRRGRDNGGAHGGWQWRRGRDSGGAHGGWPGGASTEWEGQRRRAREEVAARTVAGGGGVVLVVRAATDRAWRRGCSLQRRAAKGEGERSSARSGLQILEEFDQN